MKKSIFLLTAGWVSAAILTGHVLAQDIKHPADLASAQGSNKPAPVAVGSNSSRENTAAASTVNLHALKDFKGRFASVKDEKWFSLKEGFIAYFTQDGFRNRAYYSKRGTWLYSLQFCDEKKLPRDVRAMVKSTYYDFTITVVEIVEIPNHLVYLIHLEDATNIKIVRVSAEGDMDVYQEFKKS